MAQRLITVLLGLGLCVPGPTLALQDPTAPPMARPSRDGLGMDFPLTAIMRVGGRRVAIIGGVAIGVGDRYQGARMVRITDSEVVLRRNGETMVHRLYPQVDKRPRGK